jgi:DNA (cytosine-5)-methyltransferase 1
VKPRLLDLFCGAGGCTKGYQRAGFYVVGVDINPMPNYCGDEFFQANALDVLWHVVHQRPYFGNPSALRGPFDAIHASPPCHRYSILRHAAEMKGSDQPDLVGPTRDLLEETGLPWVIENVPGAPLLPSIELCGSMFGLGSGDRQLRRHRLFESNVPMMQPACQHRGEAIGVYGGGPTGRYTFGNGAKKDYYGQRGGYQGRIDEKREAMDIDWMNAQQLNQAIPPAYTEHIGHYLMAEIKARQAA